MFWAEALDDTIEMVMKNVAKATRLFIEVPFCALGASEFEKGLQMQNSLGPTVFNNYSINFD